MIRFFLRRLTFALLLVVAVSSGALFLTRLAPGDVTANLGAFARPEEVAHRVEGLSAAPVRLRIRRSVR